MTPVLPVAQVVPVPEDSLNARPNLKVAVLGAGGLGRGMAQMVQARRDFQLCAIADTTGYAFNEAGLCLEALMATKTVENYAAEASVVPSTDAIQALFEAHGSQLDAVFLALPNLPVDFFAKTLRRLAESGCFQGVLVDALKRTQAVEHLLPLDSLLRSQRMLYITGAGATPGFLTTVAAVAAQSFVEVEAINLHFGVGVSNWEQYRATIREDLLHLPGFNAERVAAMSDAEIEAELDRRNGLIELVNMEHADDIILELAGVCPRERITVGGLVDTRNAQKPCSTTVTVKGRTLTGEVGEHVFTVSDATTMVDNVCGPACGFMLRGVELYQRGQYGLLTSAEVMPRYRLASPKLQAEPLEAAAAPQTLAAV